jgi:hypothetical protein
VRIVAVSSTPNLHALPGSNVLQKLIDGAQGWGLALSLLGLFVGMAVWASRRTFTTHTRHCADGPRR